MKNKKGLSHIEVILSFVIFLGFLIFILAIFNPFRLSSDNAGEIYLAEKEIVAYSSLEVKFLSLVLNYIPNKCFYFNYSLDEVIAKDEFYNFTPAYSIQQNNEIYINGTNRFYYILSSDEFEERDFSGQCTGLEKTNYTLGLFTKYNMTSYAKMTELANRHNSDYLSLKSELKIPASDDFAFSISDSLNNLLLNISKKPPSNAKVVARDVPIQLVYKNGTIIYAKLNIKVW